MTSENRSKAADKEARLNAVIAEYLKRKDAGQPIEPEKLLNAYPDLRNELRSWFSGEELLQAPEDSATKLRAGSNSNGTLETIHPGSIESETASEFHVRSFGRYQLLRPLGEGAMGSVYLAKDTTLDRLVALKMPKEEGTNNSEFMLRFTREARAAAALSHENICSVYDAGEHDGVAYITMDFIDGAPLSRFVASPNLTSLDSVLEMVEAIARAVGHAHEKGVVHRDLKPGNIIIDHDMKPFVTDFGLARRIDSKDESRITQEGLIVGTPAYMAPEQIKGQQKQVGPRSDIYSLGVILFELLTARLPFEGRVAELLAKSLRDDPPVPSRIRKDLPEFVDDICLKMLKKDASARYASMAKVQQAIQQTRQKLQVANQTGSASSSSKNSRLDKFKSNIESMLKDGQYAEAIQHLKQTAADERESIRTIAQWARKKLLAVKKESRALDTAGLNALLATGEEMFKRHDYRGCIQLIEDVPPVRRTDEMDCLLRRAEQTEIDAERMLAEIKTLEHNETVAGLAPKVKKFLRLKPGNKYAKRLWEALNTYSNIPHARRRYCFEAGRLQPVPETNFFKKWVTAAAVTGLVVFGCVYSYTIFYLKSGQQTLVVKVDDDWLKSQGGELTLSVDGNEYTIASKTDGSQPISLTVNFGPHSFSVSNGDTVVHDPRTFEITKDGRQVLYISSVNIELLGRGTASNMAGTSSTKPTSDTPEVLRPLGLPTPEPRFDEAQNNQLNDRLTMISQVHGANEEQLQRWADNLPNGYRPYWITLRAAGKEVLFDALARIQPNPVEWKLVTIDGYNDEQYEQAVAGYRPAIVNVFDRDGMSKRQFLLAKESGWQYWIGTNGFIDKKIKSGFEDTKKRGNSIDYLVPTSLTSRMKDGATFSQLCMAYGPYSEGQLLTDLKMDQIQTMLLGNHNKGWRLHLLTGIQGSSNSRFNAVLVKNTDPKLRQDQEWAVSPRLTVVQYEEILEKVDALGGFPKCVASTIEDGRVIYRVLWNGISQLEFKAIPIFADPDSPTEVVNMTETSSTKPTSDTPRVLGPLDLPTPEPRFDETQNNQLNDRLTMISQVHGANEEQLQKWADNLPNGYRPYWISLRAAGKEMLFDGLARMAPNQVEWKLGFLNNDEHRKWATMSKGFSLAMVNGSPDDGKVREQVLLMKSKSVGENWRGNNQFVGEKMQAGFDRVKTNAGEVQRANPIHMSPQYLKNGLHCYVCMGDGPYESGEFLTNLSMEQLGSKLMGYHKKGMRLHLMAGIRGSVEPRFNAIFVKNVKIKGSNSDWSLSPRLTVEQYEELLVNVDALGGRPRCVASTIEFGKVVYRVLWDEIGRLKLKTVDPLSR